MGLINSPSFDEKLPKLIDTLAHEKDWEVLCALLAKLPYFLTTEALIHNSSPENINKLTQTLCHMVENVNFEHLSNTPDGMNKAFFQSYIYPILSNLVAYHKLIEPPYQSALVKVLTGGLPFIRQSTCQCINALSLCVVEMQDTMIKYLPDVLLSLTKNSATVQIAIPILEFLSYVTLHPRLYKDFVSNHYLSIFATVLPFTNPSRFSDFIVAMAFRVMSMWFLKCRLPYRKVIISYIIRGLQVNVIQSIKESEEIRKRSGSFNSDVALKSNESLSNNAQNASNSNTALTHSNEKFHKELVESHMDLLSRYTQGLCSTLPEPMSGQDMILDRSITSTWLLGQRLITITTSGCRSRTFLDGYCERCYRFCKLGSGSDFSNDDVFNPTRNSSMFNDPGNFNQPPDYGGGMLSNVATNYSENERNTSSSRRRHQSAFTPNLTSSSKPTSRAFDDSHLNFNSSFAANDDYEESSTCSCWCEGWAEIIIRRASGTTSWKMRIQNRLNVPCYPCNPFDSLTNDLTPIYPSKPVKNDSVDGDSSVVRGEDALASDTPESSPPVFKRVSSSPDMERGEDVGQNSKNLSASGSPATAIEVTSDNGEANRPVEEEVIAEENNLAKLSRASSLGRGDTTKTSPFSRASSFSWKSPSRFTSKKSEVSSPGYESVGKEVFFNSDTKPDSDQEPMTEGKNYSNQSIISPLKATLSSNMPSNPRTPPKTPAKLEDINESKTENFSYVPRGRLATISVMTPALVRSNATASIKRSSSNQRITEVSNPRNDGIKPSFIFLQLFYDSSISDGFCKSEKPLILPSTESIRNALTNLDRILPHEMHKIGVIYIDSDQQQDLSQILSNRYGSFRYMKFIRGLGTLIKLKDIDTSSYYIGGLAKDGKDGVFAVNWKDNLTQVVFHISTLMPNKENDPDRNDKKLHIGNDCICIMYNNSGQEIDVNSLRISKPVVAAIVIRPLEYENNHVMIHLFEDGLKQIIGPRDSVILSDVALPSYVRQLSLNLNIASLIYHSKRSSTGSLYASNCVERLRQIERIKQKTLEHKEERQQKSFSSFSSNSRSTIPNSDLEDDWNPSNFDKFPDDFTPYI
ncbi:tuberin [Tetranychus urticae]|uniref:Rap-GAP domain-containing protein n=1 Tax=Tetranychus urticae TaxID=32264 RepID=T1KZ85_TETUR|nr:tuberin [Tetranychus urticae]